jgi:predicted dehydrogenase
MPCRIDAKVHNGKWHDIEVEDDVTAYVEYPNGATGTFITTTGDAPGANRFEIVCDGGTLVCENDQLVMKKLGMFESEHTKVNKELFAGPSCETIHVETDGKNPQHEGVREAFAAAILRNEPMIADGREGINGLTISNAMHLSAWTNKTIELPLDENLFYELLMERVKTSRRKENVVSVVADLSGTYNS